MAMTTTLPEQQIREYVSIINATHTESLHDWNKESLDRAFGWARWLEAIHEQHVSAGTLDTARRQFAVAFPRAKTPTMASDECFTFDSLHRATSLLRDALLVSPFVATHPIQSEMLLHLLQASSSHTATNSFEAVGSNRQSQRMGLSDALVLQHMHEHKRSLWSAAASALSEEMPLITVRVRSHSLRIPPQERYLRLPNTIAKRCAARASQDVLISVRTHGDSQYQRQLADLLSVLNDVDRQEQWESIGLMLVLEWPKREINILNDLVQGVVAWSRTDPVQLFVLPPCLAAMVCAAHPALADIYIPFLVSKGFIVSTLKTSYTERIGMLALLAPRRLDDAIDAFTAVSAPGMFDDILSNVATVTSR